MQNTLIKDSFPTESRAHFLRLLLVALITPVIWACAPIASVEETTPSLPAAISQPDASPELKKARLMAESANALIQSDPKEAMAESETAAKISLNAINTLPASKSDQAIALYNYSVARLVESTLQSGEQPWKQDIQLAGPKGRINLSMTDLSRGSWLPPSDQLLATDRMEIGGTYFPDRVSIEGIGAPLVSTGPGRTEPWTPDKHYFGVTALARISGSKCCIEIIDPSLMPTVSFAAKSRTLAADFSAPLALGIKEERPQKFGFRALLRTDRYMQAAKFIMVEPYRPNRQPIILIHGLGDSPITWTPMVNALNADPEIRRKYQIWVFRYPTGLPFPMSASLLRQELAAVYQKYPDTPKSILIGHSMGGLLAQMQICNSGDNFCIDVLGKPLDQFQVEPDELLTLQGALYFKTSPYVAEAIFLATPHRGAQMASGPLGRLGAALVRLPGDLIAAGPTLIRQINETEGENLIRRFPNSIDTLRPEGRVVKALTELKITSSIPYYSIIGDRGRGEGKDSSDGVVPYESSHLDGAKSELIVPCGHTVQQNPHAIVEVQRILLSP